MMKILLLSLLLMANTNVLFSMEITEHKKYTVPPLQQLCAEACAQYKLNYEDITQPCKNLIKQHGYYKEPLTKRNVESIALEAQQRGDAKKLQECRNVLLEIMPEDEDEYLLNYDRWLTIQKSAFRKIIEKTTIINDVNQLSMLMNDSAIQQQRDEYIEKRNFQRQSFYLDRNWGIIAALCWVIFYGAF